MSKTLPLADFLRTYNLKDSEILSVAKSMDEDDLRVEFLQFGKVNGMSKDFMVQMDFVKAKSAELPWKGLKIGRCAMSASANNECAMMHPKGVVKVSYNSCTVTVEDGYESAFSVFR
jgi:hypothetical protein